jgi:hypothetical protein
MQFTENITLQPQLLALMLRKDFWRKYKAIILPSMFPSPMDRFYISVASFHEKFEEDLDKVKLWEIIKMDNPTATDAQKVDLYELCSSIKEVTDWSHEFAEKVLTKVWQQEVYRQVTEIGVQGLQGKLTSLEPLADIYNKHAERFIPKDSFKECDLSIRGLMDSDSNTPKWNFALKPLQDKIGGMSGGQFLEYAARPDAGKCFAINTPILMYNGSIKAVQDVQVGDKVMGPDSKPRTVLALGRGTEQMYDITYPWGDKYTVNASHILSLKRSKNEGPHKTGDILNVALSEYLTWPESRKGRYKGWKAGVEFEDEDCLLIDPYMVGLWLGDGSSAKPQITTVEPEIISYIQSYAVEHSLRVTPDAISYSLVGSGGYFRSLLRTINVLHNKHIPGEYLKAGRQNRLKLLAGLIDSDGHYGGSSYEVTFKNKTLAENTVFLARSLGMHATSATVVKTCQTGASGEYVRIHIAGPGLEEIPVKLDRKRAKSKVKPKRSGLHFGIEVTPAGVDNYYGFTVDGDHLFLLGDFTVVHNTALMTTFMCGPGGWAEQGAMIDYYGNEEAIKRTRWRCISAYTGLTKEQLMKDPEAAEAVWQKVAQNVRTFEIPFGTPIEQIIARTKTRKPNIVIVDQLDKMSVQSLTSGGFQNEQDRTRLLRIKYRDMGKTTDSLVIGVGQASADAEGQRIVTYSMGENSKTGKGAECDVFLGIGMSPLKDNILEVDYTRWITVSKNKLDMSWKGTFTCKLEPMISRYVE